MQKTFPTREVEIAGNGFTFTALAEYYPETGNFRVARCRKCDAEIFFAKTKKGKFIPLDLADDGGVHKVHFATCPNADEFRKS